MSAIKLSGFVTVITPVSNRCCRCMVRGEKVTTCPVVCHAHTNVALCTICVQGTQIEVSGYVPNGVPTTWTGPDTQNTDIPGCRRETLSVDIQYVYAYWFAVQKSTRSPPTKRHTLTTASNSPYHACLYEPSRMCRTNPYVLPTATQSSETMQTL